MTVFLLSFVSGLLSLGYQVVWFRVFADRYGSTNLTFVLVLVGFIGGLGLGSIASSRITRLAARFPRLENPLTCVAAIELAIAASALASVVFDPSRLIPSTWIPEFPYVPDARGIFEPLPALRIANALATVAIVVPTFLMGTTFPILCAAFRARRLFPSELYAWNTMGACSGVLVTEFLLLPYVGHTRAFYALAAANVLLALAFLAYARSGRSRRFDTIEGEFSLSRRVRNAREFHPGTILVAATLSGFVSGALEVDMFRYVRFAGAISDAAMSFTSFWAIVAIFTASWTVRALGSPRPGILRTAVLGALVVHGASWLWLPEIRAWFNRRYVEWLSGHAASAPELASATIYPLSGSLPLLLAFTGTVVFPAYFLVSLVLPSVCNVAQAEGRGLGRAYGLNTLAFCVGAVSFTWVAPGVNLFYAVKLLFVVLAAAALVGLTLRAEAAPSRAGLAVAALIVLLGIVLVPRGFAPEFFASDELPARYPVRALKSNGAHTTYVVEDPEGDVLYFDSHPMSGTGPLAQRYMRLMAHVPLLAQADPRRVLLVCFGVGNTARAIAAHESVDEIDIVDLNDRVFETAAEFATANDRVYDDPRVRMIHDDGRTFLENASRTYDLVTSEPPPPRSAGVYRLYSVEYYRSVLDRLTPSGMMTQWLPLNVLSQTAADRIVASFAAVFPHVLLFVGSDSQLILLGGRQPFDARMLEVRFAEATGARRDLAALGIRDPVAILARIMRVDDALRRDVASARVISDERNDLAHAVTDPFDPPSVAIDPRAVFDALTRVELSSARRLADALSNPRKLRIVVPDFPFALVRTNRDGAG